MADNFGASFKGPIGPIYRLPGPRNGLPHRYIYLWRSPFRGPGSLLVNWQVDLIWFELSHVQLEARIDFIRYAKEASTPNYAGKNLGQTSWMNTHWVTGQYWISWLGLLRIVDFLGSVILGIARPPGDFLCKHTPPRAHKKPVILAHSLIWSWKTVNKS